MAKRVLLGVLMALFINVTAFAAHPLITDDAGTQGKGNFQAEVNSEFSRENEQQFNKDEKKWETKKETGGELATILSYGITDNTDIVLGLPYQWKKTRIDGLVTTDATEQGDGISDMSLEVKWRFFEKDELSLALKPGVTLPTGNENKGLGNGRASYGLMFITTTEIKPWAFHLNLGYTHNAYKLQADRDANRKDIWHASLASEVEVIKELKAVANIGIERNPDKTSNTQPAFILGGLIYSIAENIAVDIGVKGGLNKPETDLTFLAGIALKF
ncbi:MAG: transporter [Nitrospirae bacterium]|nr:MAG: transporter [Nitrospirota bacterium]